MEKILILTILKFLGASPFVLQRMIIRVTSPLFTAATLFIGTYIFQSPLILSLLGLICLMLLSRSYYNYKEEVADIKGISTLKRSSIAAAIEMK